MHGMNLHPLFTAKIVDCFEEQIALSRAAKLDLLAARTVIRAHLRSELPKRLAAAHVDNPLARAAIRFITQGSYAYNLINAPARPPEQQADLDDGAYIPLTFCEDTGSPKAVSRLLIEASERSLTDLARKRGWSVDTKNPNCTRIIISVDKHVDVPLYSIPDEEFIKITEERHRLVKGQRAFDAYADSADMDDIWDVMPRRVRLAHKERGWVDSDPRPVRDWIEVQVKVKSEQLRRLIRYLKAWRDAQIWPAGDPKSLLIMALTNAGLEKMIEGRDDLALIAVCRTIPEQLTGRVMIPALPGEDLAHPLITAGGAPLFISRISTLQSVLSESVRGRYPAPEVCRLLRQQFGPRFPDRPDRVGVETPEAVVHAVSPRRIPAAPIVGRRQAG